MLTFDVLTNEWSSYRSETAHALCLVLSLKRILKKTPRNRGVVWRVEGYGASCDCNKQMMRPNVVSNPVSIHDPHWLSWCSFNLEVLPNGTCASWQWWIHAVLWTIIGGITAAVLESAQEESLRGFPGTATFGGNKHKNHACMVPVLISCKWHFHVGLSIRILQKKPLDIQPVCNIVKRMHIMWWLLGEVTLSSLTCVSFHRFTLFMETDGLWNMFHGMTGQGHGPSNDVFIQRQRAARWQYHVVK